MASLREILSFVINADASQAIREFDKLEKSSTASLGKMEKAALGDKLARTGAIMGGITLVAGAGLVNMASAAADLDRSMGRVNATFGKGAADVSKWAKSANEVFLSDRQAMKYAAALGETAQGMGLAADQAAKLVPNVLEVASQLAVLKGMNVDDAITAISSAMIGEYDATQRLIPALNQRRINEEALAASGKESEKQLTSAEKTLALLNIVLKDGNEILAGNSDALNSASADWEKLKTKLDDVKTSVGAGVLDVFGPALDGLAAAADQLERIPEPVKQVFGSIAAGAVALSGIVSLFSFIGSGAIKAVDAVKKLSGSFRDAEGNITRFGQATQLAFSGIAIAAAVIAFKNLTEQIDESTENVIAFDTATKRLSMAKTTNQIAAALHDASDAQQGWWDKVTGFGKTVNQINFDGMIYDVDRLQESFDEMAKTDPETALKGLNFIIQQTPKNQQLLIGGLIQLRDNLQQNVDVTKQYEKETAKSGDANEDAANAALDNADASKQQEEAIKAATNALKDEHGQLGFVSNALGLLSARAKGFGDAIEGIATDEVVEGALSMGEAFGEVKDTLKDLPRKFDESKAAMGGYSEAQSTALTNLLGMGQAIREQAGTMLENGRSAQEVASRTVLYRDALAETMKQAGLTKDQIKEYQRVMGLTDEDILTTIKLSGDAEAKFKLGLMLQLMEQLAIPVTAEVIQKIIAGDYQGAAEAATKGMQDYANKHPVKVPVRPELDKAAEHWMRTVGGGGGTIKSAPPAGSAPIYIDERKISVAVTNPPGTRDTVKNIKRALKINGGEMRKVLAV